MNNDKEGYRYRGRLVVGSRVIAKMNTGVCTKGEHGIVYEVYQRGTSSEGYGVIFQNGLYDGFSPEDVDLILRLTNKHHKQLAGYKFHNVLSLMNDYRRGLFNFDEPCQ